MKRIYVLFLAIVLIPSILFAWTDPSGSTFTVTTGSMEIKDIVNAAWDSVNNCFTVKFSSSVSNFPSEYPDSIAQSSLSSIDTNTGNIYSKLSSTPSITDIRYTNKISTGTSGKLLISGNITIPNSIDGYSFCSVGGDTEINANWKKGTLYCIDGIPIAPTKLSIPVASPTLNCVLNYGTTLYYDLNCVNP